MNVLGIHSLGHDTGVSLFRDGRLVFAVETERLTRVKHDHRAEIALAHLLETGLLDLAEVDLVAVSTGVRQALLNLPHPERTIAALDGERLHHETTCVLHGVRLPCLVVLHEASHAALALHYAGYSAPCTILVNEGRGQISRNSLYRYDGRGLALVESDRLPWYGTGWGWSALGWLFGMGLHPGVAGKVMALGGFGGYSAAAADLLTAVDDRVLHDEETRQRLGRELVEHPLVNADFQARADLVHTFQRLFTSALLSYLQPRLAAGGGGLALGGGCALNILANSEIRKSLAPRLAIPPACNDAGHALGAALYAMRFHLGLVPEPFDCYVNGVAEGPETVRSTLAASGLHLSPLDFGRVASRLAAGAVVAVTIGASEIGPRALGNRSLLAHPGREGMKKRLSEGVKQREWYRPLGAAIRLERFAEIFGGEPPSPHMLYSYACPPGLIPEATHADGTSRLQTVTAAEHPFLHRLLGEFEERSGCPALINTSLNRRERAIAYRARDVLDDFLDADVDLFVFGDLMAERESLGA